jgi:hypothetical protein
MHFPACSMQFLACLQRLQYSDLMQPKITWMVVSNWKQIAGYKRRASFTRCTARAARSTVTLPCSVQIVKPLRSTWSCRCDLISKNPSGRPLC